MSFLRTGINNQPLKKQGNRKLKFSEFGIIQKDEPEQPDRSKSLEIARNLPSKHELDHEFLVEHFGR